MSTVLKVDFGRGSTAPVAAAKPAPVPDFLTPKAGRIWLQIHYGHNGYDHKAAVRAEIAGDMDALLTVLESATDPAIRAAGADRRRLWDEWRRTPESDRPTEKQLAAVPGYLREIPGLTPPEDWHVDRKVCGNFLGSSSQEITRRKYEYDRLMKLGHRMPSYADWVKNPVLPSQEAQQALQAESEPVVRLDVARRIAAQVGVDPSVVLKVDRLLTEEYGPVERFGEIGTRGAPEFAKPRAAAGARLMRALLEERFQIRTVRMFADDVRKRKIEIAIPYEECSFNDGIALVRVKNPKEGQKAITAALAEAMSVSRWLIDDADAADAVGDSRLKWIAIWSDEVKLADEYDGSRLAGQFGIGILNFGSARACADLQLHVSGERLWSSLFGYRPGGETWRGNW